MPAKRSAPRKETSEESFEELVKEAYTAGFDATLRLSMLPIKLYTRTVTAYVRMMEEALQNTSGDN